MNLHQIYSPERDIYLRELKERGYAVSPLPIRRAIPIS